MRCHIVQVSGRHTSPDSRIAAHSAWSETVDTVYEVFKRVLQQRGEDDALQAVAVRMQGLAVDLNSLLALYAAKISVELTLPMADSIVLAMARTHDAVLWTQDANFKNMVGVHYIGA